jgi:hypothetical protein
MDAQIIRTQGLDGVTVDLHPDCHATRAAILQRSAQIVEVVDELDADLAMDAIRDINGHLKAVEACRKEVKAPVLELGKAIDRAAAEHVAALETEKQRIERLSSGYIAAQRRAREEAEAKARMEARRLMAEAEEARRKAEEEARAAGHNEQAIAHVVTQVTIDAAKAAQEVQAEARAAHVVPKGVGIRTKVHFKILDERAMHAARPDLFSPDESKIRKAIGLTHKIPGLQVWTEEIPTVK